MKENRIRTNFFAFFSKYIPVPLLIVLLLSLFKGILWISIIPPFQTPDEPAHFTYVQYLAEEGKLPIRGDVSNYEASISKELTDFLSYTMFSDISHYHKLFDLDDSTKENILKQSSDYEDRRATGSNYITSYPPGYYAISSLFYKLMGDQSLVYRYYSVKFLSLFLSLATVWATYMIGALLKPRSKTFPTSLAVVTSLHPMFSMLSTSVTNDILMICISTLIIYWALNIILFNNAPSKKIFYLGGLLIGIGLLSKAQVLYVSFFSIVILIYYLFKKGQSIKQIVVNMLRVSVPSVLLYGSWSIFSLKHYQSLFGVMGFNPVGYDAGGTLTGYINTIAPSISIFLSNLYAIWIKTYWGFFGWLNVPFMNDSVYDILLIITLTALIGVIYVILSSIIKKRIEEKTNFSVLVICLLFVIGNILFLYTVEFIYYSKNLETMMQGRYLFTALIPINILLINGCQMLVPKKNGKFVDVTFILGIIILNVYSIFTMLESYYGVAIL